jgi:hypothetical protein
VLFTDKVRDKVNGKWVAPVVKRVRRSDHGMIL